MQQQHRLLLIGLIAVVVAGILTFFSYRNVMSKVNRVKAQSTKVVVAKKDLPVGSLVSEDDVTTLEVPVASVPQGALLDPAKAVKRGVVVPLTKNEVVLESKLAMENAGAGLPAMIPANMRAVSVQVNDVIAVAGFVTPGTHVDVLLTGSTNGNSDFMTTTVLENVEVLAAGKKIQPDAEGKAETVPVITLMVSPEDAQKLTLASSQGKIQLSLRNPLDHNDDSLKPVHNATLYHEAAAEIKAPQVKRTSSVRKAPVPAPVEAYAVEVIRGDKRDITKF